VVLRTFPTPQLAINQLAAQGVVSVDGRDWGGSSGIIIKPGIVVTAEAAPERDDEINVILPDGQEVTATVAGRDPTTDDIAVLRVGGCDLTEAKAATLPLPGAIVIGVGRVGKDVVARLDRARRRSMAELARRAD